MSENLVSHQIVTLVTITRYYSVNNGSPACKRPVFLCFSARSALSLICHVQFHFMPNLNLIAVLFRVVLPPAVFGSLTERPVWISYLCTLVIFPWTLNLCRPTLILSCITVDKSYDSCFNLKTIQNIPKLMNHVFVSPHYPFASKFQRHLGEEHLDQTTWTVLEAFFVCKNLLATYPAHQIWLHATQWRSSSIRPKCSHAHSHIQIEGKTSGALVVVYCCITCIQPWREWLCSFNINFILFYFIIIFFLIGAVSKLFDGTSYTHFITKSWIL